MLKVLSDHERAGHAAGSPAWTYDPDRRALHRQVIFEDFAQALGAMVRIGVHAERMNHHPEWLNVYNRVDIWLTTHDAGGVTIRDLELARLVDGVIA